MSLIRYAARTHRVLGWCVYDHKFRQKGSLNQSLNWSDIDQQLWLIIFTVSPDVLRRENPLFHHGPKNQVPQGAKEVFALNTIDGGNAHIHNVDISTSAANVVASTHDVSVEKSTQNQPKIQIIMEHPSETTVICQIKKLINQTL